MAVSLEDIFSIDDIVHRHLLPFVSCQDIGRLEATSSNLKECLEVQQFQSWKIICERDFSTTNSSSTATTGNNGNNNKATAPLYNAERQSFDTLKSCETWKHAYQQWKYWEKWTHGGAKAQHMVQAIQVWQRLRAQLVQHEMHNILNSFLPCLDADAFQELAGSLPSSMAAFFSICGGQQNLRARTSTNSDFFGGLMGSYSCYNDYYSMRITNVMSHIQQLFYDSGNSRQPKMLIGMSPGTDRVFLCLEPTLEDPEGQISMHVNGIRETSSIVGSGGFLNYLQTYVERLEAGVYRPTPIVSGARGIALFPDANVGSATAMMSSCVTNGIEVRASARWLPTEEDTRGLNFGYSIRIRLVADNSNSNSEKSQSSNRGTCRLVEPPPPSSNHRTYQLVGRHWEFTYGDGSVRRVDGEGVIGKQPQFFIDDTTGQSGFVDLGPAGDGQQYFDTVFVYQSQSGYVAGTTQQDTKAASVQGTFSFLPGSIQKPTGPMFHVTVAPFPLTVPYPFY